MRESRISLAILLTAATLGLAPWSVAPAARSSTAQCMKGCNDSENACKEECLAQRDGCLVGCQDLPGDQQSECIEACNVTNDACYASCAAFKDECKAACPRGDESPSDPLP